MIKGKKTIGLAAGILAILITLGCAGRPDQSESGMGASALSSTTDSTALPAESSDETTQSGQQSANSSVMLSSQQKQPEKETSSKMISSKQTQTLTQTVGYYLDAVNGDDRNDGKSQEKPWKSLEKLNQAELNPGDTIYLKSGSVFNGQFKPASSGVKGKPIVMTSYGGSKKPVIAGGGVQPAAVYLYNVEYWEISNIEITNYHKTVNLRSGIMVENDIGKLSHIYLRNLEVHQVNGENVDSNWGYDRTNGGIIFYMKGYGEPAYMDDVLIEGNNVYEVDRSGIFFYSSWCNRNSISEGYGRWKGSTNVVVRNNKLNDIGGDGIVLAVVDGGLIEHNVATYCNTRSGKNNGAIWCGNSDNTIIQYNEAAYTQLKEGDGMGFDIDFGGENNILQYNYSHDNEGGFLLVTSVGNIINKNAIVRYNISQNDKSRIFRVVGKKTTNCQIYNNVVYLGKSMTSRIVETTSSYEGDLGEAYFYNNIIINHGQGGYAFNEGAHFSNNCFYATQTRRGEPNDPYKITADPKLANPGSGKSGIASLSGYQLTAGSPCIGAGKLISGFSGMDFFGNKLTAGQNTDIGAHQFR